MPSQSQEKPKSSRVKDWGGGGCGVPQSEKS